MNKFWKVFWVVWFSCGVLLSVAALSAAVVLDRWWPDAVLNAVLFCTGTYWLLRSYQDLHTTVPSYTPTPRQKIEIIWPDTVCSEPTIHITADCRQEDGSFKQETWTVEPDKCGWSDMILELHSIDPIAFDELAELDCCCPCTCDDQAEDNDEVPTR